MRITRHFSPFSILAGNRYKRLNAYRLMELAWENNLLIILAFAAAAVGAVIVREITLLLGYRIQLPKFQLKKGDDLPPYLKKLYADAVKQLTPLGFKVQHCQLSQDIVVQGPAQKWSLILVHPDTRVFAEISPASTSLDMPGYEVNFWSIAPDGNALLTMNGRGHTVMAEIPGVTIHDPMIQSLHQQYDVHLEERREWSSTTNYQLLNPVAYIASQQKLMDGYFANLKQEHAIRKKGENHFRLSLFKCLKMAFPYFKGEQQARKLLQARFKAKLKNKLQGTASKALSSSAYPVETDVLAYKRLSTVHQRYLTNLFPRFMLVGATWFIIYFVLGLKFSQNSLIILLGVILLHELGHIVAMLIFRYRDIQILSVPLFGWADPAKKQSAKGVAHWKQVVVYLMGPVPGIALGLVMIVVNKNSQFPHLYEAATVMVLFNYLHMLPFMSLDGGRIMRLVAMQQFPSSKLLFPLVSGGLFAAGGYYLGEPVFWALCMIIIASIPFGVRQSALLRAMRKIVKEQRKKDPHARDFYSLDINNKLARVFLALKRPRFRKLNFLLKYQLVQALDGIVHQPSKSNGLTSVLLLSTYLVALVVTPQAILITAQQAGQAPQLQSKYWGQKVKNDLESRISRANSPRQRFTLLTKAADGAMESGQLSKAADYLKRAESPQRHIKDNSTLAQLSFSYAKLHLLQNQPDDAAKYQQKAIALYEIRPKAHYFQLAKSYEQLSRIQLKLEHNYEAEGSLQKALSFAIKTQKPEQWYMITKLSGQLLDWYYLEDRQTDANRLLSSLMNHFKQKDTPLKDYVARFVYEEMGWLHAAANDEKAAMEKFDKALALSEKYAAQLKSKHPDGRETTKLLLAKAAVYYKEGYNDFSKIQFSNAEDAARESSFNSLQQYIDKYAPKDLSIEIKKDYHREAKRWKLITDAYRKTHSS